MNLGVDLREDWHSQGQLYVTLSEAPPPLSFIVLSKMEYRKMRNIVRSDVLSTNWLVLHGLLPLHVIILYRESLGRFPLWKNIMNK